MDKISFLEELISIPSPSGEEDAVAEHLVGRMTALGFRAHRDEAGNAVGIVGNANAEREIVLLGHMDTVPGSIPVRRCGDLLYGRGARYLARTMPSPDCVIIGEPGHWEGVTLGYKGMLAVDYVRVQPGAHSAGEMPGPAEKAVAFWNRLMVYAEAYNGGRSGRFNTLDPALRDFRTFSDGLDDGAEMNIVVRIPPGVEAADLKEKMLTWCNGDKLTFPGSDPPFRSEKNIPPVRALLRAIRAEGGRPRFKLKTGTSDMNVVGPAWQCPIVAYGPGDSSLDHTPDEHVDVREFRRGVRVLARALETLAG